jgi:hypothetical protein
MTPPRPVFSISAEFRNESGVLRVEDFHFSSVCRDLCSFHPTCMTARNIRADLLFSVDPSVCKAVCSQLDQLSHRHTNESRQCGSKRGTEWRYLQRGGAENRSLMFLQNHAVFIEFWCGFVSGQCIHVLFRVYSVQCRSIQLFSLPTSQIRTVLCREFEVVRYLETRLDHSLASRSIGRFVRMTLLSAIFDLTTLLLPSAVFA